MEKLFVFQFDFLDDDTEHRWELPIRNFEYDALSEQIEIEKQDLEYRFGVHDISYHPPEEVLGYNSYEVERNQVQELLKEWEEILKKFGAEIVGEWKRTITYLEGEEDEWEEDDDWDEE